MKLKCAACGMRWAVSPKPDGSMPVTSRCPKDRGGCGKLRRVPRLASLAAAAAAPAMWDPPSTPRESREMSGGCCSDCHAAVTISPRGTALWCSGCGSAVTPPGVEAPYRRGSEVTRAAKSQRERDLEAIGLAKRKGAMLGVLAQLADDERLHPESRPVVEWFSEQAKAAVTGARLDELAALLPEAGIRRRHWWQGGPVAITAGYDDEDTEDYDDDEDQADEDDVIEGTAISPVVPRPWTYGDAIQAAGWRVVHGAANCPIAISKGAEYCMLPIASPALPDGRGGYLHLCQEHYARLSRFMRDHNAKETA